MSARIEIETIRIKRLPCGFCATGLRHDLCPGGVLNGDGKTLVLCACTDHPQVIRCLACGHRGTDQDDSEVSPETWHCMDPDACVGRREKWAMDTIRDLYGTTETPGGTRTPGKPEKPAKTPRMTSGRDCVCGCGGTTKGGLFLPGHDSKYLTGVAASVKGGKYTLEDAQTLMAAQGCSDALQAKLGKRVA